MSFISMVIISMIRFSQQTFLDNFTNVSDWKDGLVFLANIHFLYFGIDKRYEYMLFFLIQLIDLYTAYGYIGITFLCFFSFQQIIFLCDFFFGMFTLGDLQWLSRKKRYVLNAY